VTASAAEGPGADAVTSVVIPVGGLQPAMSIPVDRREEPGQRLSFWYRITPAAIALGRYLQTLGTLQGCRALELGCGLVLAGVTAGKLGAEITFSDYQSQALEHARANARVNGVEKAAFCRIDWEFPGKMDRHDLILGAEILYDYFFHDGLREIIYSALAPGGRVILADRPRLVVDRFLGRLVHDGFRCDTHPDRVETDGSAPREIHVYCVYR
jgi:predicted nicotinamide N-methyase